MKRCHFALEIDRERERITKVPKPDRAMVGAGISPPDSAFMSRRGTRPAVRRGTVLRCRVTTSRTHTAAGAHRAFQPGTEMTRLGRTGTSLDKLMGFGYRRVDEQVQAWVAGREPLAESAGHAERDS